MYSLLVVIEPISRHMSGDLLPFLLSVVEGEGFRKLRAGRSKGHESGMMYDESSDENY